MGFLAIRDDYEQLNSDDDEAKSTRSRHYNLIQQALYIIAAASVCIIVWVYGSDAMQKVTDLLSPEVFHLGDLFQSHLDNGTAFTSPSKDWPTHDVNLAVLGNQPNLIRLNDSELMRPADGNKLTGDPFNLAILRLPPGLRWQYMGVSRGPEAEHSRETAVEDGTHARQQTLIGFGMNMTIGGNLVPASKATFLQIRTRVSKGCNDGMSWARIFDGPEDPRLYWSDSDTPMLTFGLPSSSEKYCRGIAMIQDVRSVWPDLTEVLAHSEQVPRYTAGVPEMEMMEVFKPGQDAIEKNWIAFFPGARSNSEGPLPHFQYSYEPRVVLQSSNASINSDFAPPKITYSEMKVANTTKTSSTCLSRAHPHIESKQFHGATPLYRLTLCRRGTCTPDHHNTVLFSLNHIKFPYSDKQMPYGRYFAMHNVTAPFEEIAIGPLFRFNGTKDDQVVYALSLTFIPKFISKGGRATQSGLSHGFLDDGMVIGLGLYDRQTASVSMSLTGEVMPGMRLCSRI